jgi:sodium/hydrogen antiporter
VSWELAIVAASVLLVAGASRRLTGTPITPQMVFVLIGVVVGPLVIASASADSNSSPVRALAEATLTIVLFADASRIKLATLRREESVPMRLLGIGLPLTIVAGAVIGTALLTHLSLLEALVLAIVLAPTDAALGQAVVTEPSLPSRIRQGLNVESGLNDGICVPLLLIALAVSEAQDGSITPHHAVTVVVEELGYGVLGGLAAGLLGALVVVYGQRRDLITGSWLQVIPVASAGLAYGFAAPLGGSGFIAAFVAGAVFGGVLGSRSETASRLDEELGELLGGVTFLVFGALLLRPALSHLSWPVVLYAVCSLTVVRMLPVALCMLGTGAKLATVAFLGWFGPRGLASIVFALIVVEEANLPGTQTILVTTYLTIGMSVFAHGVSAGPLARRYSRWYESRPSEMERIRVSERRPRGAAHVTP